MAYKIRSIDNVSKLKQWYFFDANLWLKILKPPIDLSKKDEKYLAFFERFKIDPIKPKIVVTSFLLSEVINRYIHDVSYQKFLKDNKVVNPPKSYYKQVYRPTQAFKNDFASICDDIDTYSGFFHPISDDLGTNIKLSQILQSPPASLDVNDHFYYLLARLHGYPIVTDDGDFFVEDVEILTYNNQLIDRGKASVVIKFSSGSKQP